MYNLVVHRQFPKPIGTINAQEIKFLSTQTPWEEVLKEDIPLSCVGTPDGYLFTQGSACGSLATTSIEGFNYNSDSYIWRKDGTLVDRDRYFTSPIDNTGSVVVYMAPKNQTPYHHLKLNDPLVLNLPPKFGERVLSEFGTQNSL